MDDVFVKKLQSINDWLASEYSGIRTGQAAPALLDSIKVESYGTLVPINQIGSIGIEDARTLRVSPWDVSNIPAIEKAVSEANFGVSVATDSAGLRVIFPELTSERREQLAKLAKNKLEDARVRVRGVRDDEMKRIDGEEKAGRISEDEKFDQKEKVQAKIDNTNKALDEMYHKKEDEISK